MLTKEKLENYKVLHEEVNNKIVQILNKKAEIEGTTIKGSIEGIEFFNGNIEIVTMEYLPGCGDEFEYYDFPEEYLYTDWEEEHKELVRIKREEKQKEQEEQERIKRANKLKAQREKYEELKKIFE